MAEEQQLRPMANLLAAMREGAAVLEMRPEEFIYIDRDCEYFKTVIQQIQGIADLIAGQVHWGLGESNTSMVSAGTVVDRFKLKAKGAADRNAVWEVMEQHFKIVEDIQEIHRIARDRMMEADSEFAATFSQLNETLPDRGPAPRTPEEALEALGRMPGVLGELYGPASSTPSSSPWPGVPMPGADR